ncbi:MAG: SDR family NAD(P)-dependent oxidoreductase [Roseobacter sp.]
MQAGDIDGAGLSEMAQPGFEGIPVDLTGDAAIKAAFDPVTERHGGIDALVNNAGTCFMSDFPDIPTHELDA